MARRAGRRRLLILAGGGGTLAVVVAVVLALTLSGSSGGGSSSSTTGGNRQLAFLAFTSFGSAEDQVFKVISTETEAATSAISANDFPGAQAAFRALADGVTQFLTSLRSVQFPPSTNSSVQALVTSTSQLASAATQMGSKIDSANSGAYFAASQAWLNAMRTAQLDIAAAAGGRVKASPSVDPFRPTATS
ncbi:MAG TPA: hypothetical protein VG869_12375 [Acidimicrobiia bacterium]|nr:hypothetical protein [Acidimicrobiia bacterium]